MSGEPDLKAELEAIARLVETLEPLSERSRSIVIDFVFKRLGIGPILPPAEAPPMQPVFAAPQSIAGASEEALVGRPFQVVDLRMLRGEKSPNSANEMVALMAYYLAHLAPDAERRDYIVADDVAVYFKQAGYPLPTGNHAMTLVNAKNAGYLRVKQRGQYGLSPVGFNLVEHRLGKGEPPKPRAKKRPKPVVKRHKRSGR